MNTDYVFLGEELFEVAGNIEAVEVYRNERFAAALHLAEGVRDARAEFVKIPGGIYTIGIDEELHALTAFDGESIDALHGAAPAHDVTLDAFLIARTPITQRVWDGLAEQLGVELWDQRVAESPYLPVHGLTWTSFRDVAPALNLRMPSEAEWEAAARGGSRHAFFWGDTPRLAFEYAWHGHPHEGGPMGVAQKRPNGFGLYDVAGNVWELCEDGWHDSYAGAPANGAPWTAPGEPQRVIRGGSYRSHTAAHLLCAFRSSAGLYFSGDDLGVRPVADC